MYINRAGHHFSVAYRPQLSKPSTSRQVPDEPVRALSLSDRQPDHLLLSLLVAQGTKTLLRHQVYPTLVKRRNQRHGSYTEG
jgi:hypothetical protein